MNMVCRLNRKAFKKLALPEDFQRYEYFLMKSYVDNTKNLSWCPNPSCANLVLCTEDVGRPAELVRCTCGHQYWYTKILFIIYYLFYIAFY
jgi:ariadne-1